MDTIFQVLTLAWSIQGGVLPGMETSDIVHDSIVLGPTFYSEYSFEFSYPIFSGQKTDQNGLYLGTSVRNVFINTSDDSVQIASLQDTYTVFGGLRWDVLTIGVEHACTHSVDSFVESTIITQMMFGNMDRVFVKLAGKI